MVFNRGVFIVKKLTIAILALIFANASYSKEKFDDTDGLISIASGNIICGIYGEFTSYIDAPIIYDKHYDMSKSVALKILKKRLHSRENIQKVIDNYYDGFRDVLIDSYKDRGPKSLNYHFNNFMNSSEYKKPSWIKSCDDLYSYSKLLLED